MYSYLHSSGLTGSAGSSRDPPLGVRGDLMLELSEGALLARLGLSLGCGGGWALFLPRCISRPVPSCPGNVLSHSSLMYYCSKISYNSSKPTVLANYLGNVKQWGGGQLLYCPQYNTAGVQGPRAPFREHPARGSPGRTHQRTYFVDLGKTVHFIQTFIKSCSPVWKITPGAPDSLVAGVLGAPTERVCGAVVTPREPLSMHVM